MDVYYTYTYGTCIWTYLQAILLLISPTMIVALLSPEVRTPTVLEEYLSRSLGLALITLGTINVLLTGSVPLTSSISETTPAAVTSNEADPKAPYAVPVLTISTLYHSACGFYCYAKYTTTTQFTFALASLGSSCLAAMGLWCMLFASSNGRISGKTGADKRTSGWPFGNSESARAKKREYRKGL